MHHHPSVGDGACDPTANLQYCVGMSSSIVWLIAVYSIPIPRAATNRNIHRNHYGRRLLCNAGANACISPALRLNSFFAAGRVAETTDGQRFNDLTDAVNYVGETDLSAARMQRSEYWKTDAETSWISSVVQYLKDAEDDGSTNISGTEST